MKIIRIHVKNKRDNIALQKFLFSKGWSWTWPPLIGVTGRHSKVRARPGDKEIIEKLKYGKDHCLILFGNHPNFGVKRFATCTKNPKEQTAYSKTPIYDFSYWMDFQTQPRIRKLIL